MTDKPVERDKKQKAQAEPTLIGTLDSGQDLLTELVRQHHQHLASLKILLLCTNKSIKQGGRERPGKVQKATPLIKYLTADARTGEGADVLITVSLPVWNAADGVQRQAIIDHLLTCVEVEENEENGDLKVKVVGPQVAEFAEVAERYGAYSTELRDIQSALNHATKVVEPVVRSAAPN